MEEYIETLLYIKQLDELINQKANKALKKADLTFSQFLVLKVLDISEKKTLPMKKIEKKLDIASSTSAGLICRMKLKGFIETKRSHKDARVTLVKMTKKGEEKLETAMLNTAEVKANILDKLDDKEVEGMKNFFRKSIALLNEWEI